MHRGQVALEFLTTYGWAFLIILVAIGALAYFGVFNTKGFIPEKCAMSEGFSCNDFIFREHDNSQSVNEVEFLMVNILGKTAYIISPVAIEYNDQRGNANCGTLLYDGTGGITPTPSSPLAVSAGSEVKVQCNPGTGASIVFPKAGEQVKVTFAFNYSITSGGLPHLVEGEIVGPVQSATT